jgi:hypothetical protein
MTISSPAAKQKKRIKNSKKTVPDRSGGASRPAQECGKVEKKKLDSNDFVMYLYVRCT